MVSTRSPSDDTLNEVPCVCTPYASRSYLKYTLVHVRVRWIMETPNYPSMQQKCQSLKGVEVGHRREEEEESAL